ncbi:MAG: CaiB/BaiF CoA-transferase family protein [Xanthobacteraceae bacterium]
MTAMLDGLRVVEFDAIGPAPFCGMMLADHGASVVRITRPGGQPEAVDAGSHDVLLRGRIPLTLDLKLAADLAHARELIGAADILIEGYRPGVMERFGLGPEACFADNPRLVYGRVTGWGQTGPLARHPGHDINFIALSGALAAMGEPDRPPEPPLNLLGDFAGGGMMLAFGVLAALLQAQRTGRGQVVDAAMVDGTAALMAMIAGWRNAGMWTGRRHDNLLDGGAPFYRCYATRDGRYLAAGAIEPQFYAAFRRVLGLTEPLFDAPMDRTRWPAMCARVAAVIAGRTLAEWQAAIDEPDACLTPVLTLDEAPDHPHLAARGTYARNGDAVAPGPAPRFSGPGGGTADAATPDSLRKAAAAWPVSEELRALLIEACGKA